VAARIGTEVQAAGRPGGAALRALLANRSVSVIDWPGWTRIDHAEQARATPPRVREKFTSVPEMVAAALAQPGG
jgi:hypothetical protein